MSELLDEVGKGLSGLNSLIGKIETPKLSAEDKDKINEKILSASFEFHKILSDNRNKNPKFWDVCSGLLDVISKIETDVNGLQRSDDKAQIARYRNMLFDDADALSHKFRKARMHLENLVYRPLMISSASILYSISGLTGVIFIIGLILQMIASVFNSSLNFAFPQYIINLPGGSYPPRRNFIRRLYNSTNRHQRRRFLD